MYILITSNNIPLHDPSNCRMEVLEELDCPEDSPGVRAAADYLTFWLEGVVNCTVAIAGIFANLVAALILSK